MRKYTAQVNEGKKFEKIDQKRKYYMEMPSEKYEETNKRKEKSEIIGRTTNKSEKTKDVNKT